MYVHTHDMSADKGKKFSLVVSINKVRHLQEMYDVSFKNCRRQPSTSLASAGLWTKRVAKETRMLLSIFVMQIVKWTWRLIQHALSSIQAGMEVRN